MQQKISHCKVFHPTAAEFNDFETYIATVDQSAGRDGIAKIVPPEYNNQQYQYSFDFLFD